MNITRHRRIISFFLFLSCFIMAPLATADAPAGHIYLWGEVHKVGAIEIPTDSGLTLVQAIILDGGLGDFADEHHIKILRKKSDGTTQVILANWTDIVGGGTSEHPVKANMEKDVPMQPGDVIVVAKRQVNY